MPAAEGAGAAAADTRQVVVWRVGGALLAAPLSAVVEIAPLDGDDRALTREGAVELQVPPGIASPERAGRAVVVRAPDGRTAAMAAEAVDGVHACDGAELPLPGWLRDVPADHLTGLVRLGNGRIAALLDPDRLAPA